MGLVRALARPLLAAPFIYDGINQLSNSEKAASTAQPIVAKISESTGLPNDPQLLVTANGAAMLAAGAGLATGVLRKPSAAVLAATLVPTTIAGHSFWEHTDPDERAKHMSQFVKNAGLLAGLVMTLVDTEGKPGLLYRAKLAGDSVGRTASLTRREARHAAKTARREAQHAAKTARREAKIAMLTAKDAVT